MEVIALAEKVRQQVHRFSGIVYPRISLPVAKFVEQMLYGIQASQDVKLSNIARMLEEGIALKKTMLRLSHHLRKPLLGDHIHQGVIKDARRKIHKDTFLVIDPSDIKKPYAKRMPYLATVRDGSAGELVKGYWNCFVAACDNKKRRVIPLNIRLWSADAPDFISENDHLLSIINNIRGAVKNRGIWVMDRGGDRGNLINPFMDIGIRFIVRLVGNRHLHYKNKPVLARDLARSCPMRFEQTIVKETKDGEKIYHLKFGFRKVKLSGSHKQLYLIVINGFGQEPMMLLTNVEVTPKHDSIWFVIDGYLTRWIIEETIRFIKQSYHLEDIRVLDYDRLKNMAAFVCAAAYFAGHRLGENLKLSLIANRVLKAAKRIFGVPDFHYYALADGIATILARAAIGPYCHAKKKIEPSPQQDLFQYQKKRG